MNRMATPFQKVYDAFLPHITDYSLGNLYLTDEVAYYNELYQLLNNAIVQYPNPTAKLYNHSEVMQEFNEDLLPHEISILSKLMVVEYMTPLILDETLLKQSLNSKDYRSYSPAKHGETLQKIKESLNSEVNRALSRQSYSIENIQKLFGGKS